jgi:hypothetical protein
MNSTGSSSQETITDLVTIDVSLFDPGGHPLDSRCRTSYGVLAVNNHICPTTFISMMINSMVSHGPGALETGPVCCGGAEEDTASEACMCSEQSYIYTHTYSLSVSRTISRCLQRDGRRQMAPPPLPLTRVNTPSPQVPQRSAPTKQLRRLRWRVCLVCGGRDGPRTTPPPVERLGRACLGAAAGGSS